LREVLSGTRDSSFDIAKAVFSLSPVIINIGIPASFAYWILIFIFSLTGSCIAIIPRKVISDSIYY